MKKVYAFIDSQNLNLGTLSSIFRKRKLVYRGWKLDFKKFRIYLRDKYDVAKVFLFIGYVNKNKKLYNSLRKWDYILIFKPTIEYFDSKTKKKKAKGNVDAELVLHTMIEYKNYDYAIIASGDGDFRCLVEYLNNEGKLLKLIIPNEKMYSRLLSIFNLKIIFLNNLREKLMKKGGVT